MPSTIVVDGVAYAPVIDGAVRWQIVICHRGFVFVGRVEDKENEVVIHDCSNVRKWGTTKGLGELAQRGPRSDTIVDPCGVVRVHPLAVIARIDCDEGKWK